MQSLPHYFFCLFLIYLFYYNIIWENIASIQLRNKELLLSISVIYLQLRILGDSAQTISSRSQQNVLRITMQQRISVSGIISNKGNFNPGILLIALFVLECPPTASPGMMQRSSVRRREPILPIFLPQLQEHFLTFKNYIFLSEDIINCKIELFNIT